CGCFGHMKECLAVGTARQPPCRGIRHRELLTTTRADQTNAHGRSTQRADGTGPARRCSEKLSIREGERSCQAQEPLAAGLAPREPVRAVGAVQAPRLNEGGYRARLRWAACKRLRKRAWPGLARPARRTFVSCFDLPASRAGPSIHRPGKTRDRW